MTSNLGKSTQRGIAFIITLGLLLSMVPVVPAYAALNLTDNTIAWKTAVPMNGQFDYVGDQQTGSGDVSQDLVGDNTRPVFQIANDGTSMGFRFRLNDRDGQNDTNYAFKNFAFAGVDVVNSNGTFDGKIDFFVGIYNASANKAGVIGVYNADPSKLNNSPATTGIINPALVSIKTINKDNFNMVKLDAGVSFGTTTATTDPDWLLSFKISYADINLAMQKAGKSIRLTPSTPVRFIIGTSSQTNSFNQDVGGMNGLNTKSSRSWGDLGAFTQAVSLDGNGYQVNFIENYKGSTAFSSMTAVPNYPLGVLPILSTKDDAGVKSYFLGWGTTTVKTQADFFADTPVNQPTSVYAIWTTSSSSINFYQNFSSDTTDQLYKTETVGYNAPIGSQIPTISQTGYIFLGWNSSKDGSGNYLTPDTVPQNNANYYAQWVKYFIVTFNGNGGTIGTTEIIEQNPINVPSGSSIGVMPVVASPKGTTQYLSGWNTSSDGSGIAYTANTPITQDVTLYAIWSGTSYTVTFNSNGGTTEADPTSMTIASGSPLGSLPIAPTKTNYLFDGWYTTTSYAISVTEGSIFSGTTTVYAKWTPLVTVKFYMNNPTQTVYRKRQIKRHLKSQLKNMYNHNRNKLKK